MDNAFKYAEKTPLDLESTYPYKAKKNRKCEASGSGPGKISGFADVKADSPEQLMAAVDKSPVSVAVEADKSVF